MNRPSIPPPLSQWLRRHPIALSTAIGFLNRLQRLASGRRAYAVLVITAVALLGGLLATLLVSSDLGA